MKTFVLTVLGLSLLQHSAHAVDYPQSIECVSDHTTLTFKDLGREHHLSIAHLYEIQVKIADQSADAVKTYLSIAERNSETDNTNPQDIFKFCSKTLSGKHPGPGCADQGYFFITHQKSQIDPQAFVAIAEAHGDQALPFDDVLFSCKYQF